MDVAEGIDTDLALQYYSRLCLINNLIPLLEQSVSPRVISIFLAGHEGALTSIIPPIMSVFRASSNLAPPPHQ